MAASKKTVNVKVIDPSRFNGRDHKVGEVVELDEGLATYLIELKLVEVLAEGKLQNEKITKETGSEDTAATSNSID